MSEKVREINIGTASTDNDLSALTFIPQKHTKKMLVMKGPDLPEEMPNEDPGQVFTETAHRAFSVQIQRREWAACHRLGPKKLLVSFV